MIEKNTDQKSAKSKFVLVGIIIVLVAIIIGAYWVYTTRRERAFDAWYQQQETARIESLVALSNQLAQESLPQSAIDEFITRSSDYVKNIPPMDDDQIDAFIQESQQIIQAQESARRKEARREFNKRP